MNKEPLAGIVDSAYKREVHINKVGADLTVIRFNVAHDAGATSRSTAFKSYLMIFMWSEPFLAEHRTITLNRVAFCEVEPNHEHDWRIGRSESQLERDNVFNGPCVTLEEKSAAIYRLLWSNRYDRAVIGENPKTPKKP